MSNLPIPTSAQLLHGIMPIGRLSHVLPAHNTVFLLDSTRSSSTLPLRDLFSLQSMFPDEADLHYLLGTVSIDKPVVYQDVFRGLFYLHRLVLMRSNCKQSADASACTVVRNADSSPSTRSLLQLQRARFDCHRKQLRRCWQAMYRHRRPPHQTAGDARRADSPEPLERQRRGGRQNRVISRP